MKPARTCAAMAVAALLAFSSAAASELTTDWSHCAPIRLERPPGAGVVELELTSEIFDRARGDLADLRVVGEAGGEAPYVLRTATGTVRKEALKAALYNRTYRAGGQSSVTADFGRKALKNRIEIVTPGTSFRRKVLVEGSDDGRNWSTVREGAFVFRLANEATGEASENRLVRLSDNDQRYLRVTVYPGPEDSERVEIQDISAWRLTAEPPETDTVSPINTEVTERPRERRTDIDLDLSYRNLPLHEMALHFGDANFFRQVTVLGRDRKERVVRTRIEDRPVREQVVPEAWTPITGAVIYRFPGGPGAGGGDEALVLNLSGARYRYLELQIQNGDDPPLHFEGAGVTRLRTYLAFQAKWPGAYKLYAGNQAATQPAFDIVHYIQRLRGEGVTTAQLGALAPNPAYRVAQQAVPWSERHKGLIWAALLAALAVLGLLVYRQIKAPPSAGT